jgi:hypothetical protein
MIKETCFKNGKKKRKKMKNKVKRNRNMIKRKKPPLVMKRWRRGWNGEMNRWNSELWIWNGEKKRWRMKNDRQSGALLCLGLGFVLNVNYKITLQTVEILRANMSFCLGRKSGAPVRYRPRPATPISPATRK